MKRSKSLLSILLVTGALGLSVVPAGAESLISKDVVTEGGYCHMKFPAIREETLGWSRPVLKDKDAGDIIDFYGPCNHDPLGKEEIQSQRARLRRRLPED